MGYLKTVFGGRVNDDGDDLLSLIYVSYVRDIGKGSLISILQ